MAFDDSIGLHSAEPSALLDCGKLRSFRSVDPSPGTYAMCVAHYSTSVPAVDIHAEDTVYHVDHDSRVTFENRSQTRGLMTAMCLTVSLTKIKISAHDRSNLGKSN